MFGSDRETGILTESQREFLKGNKTLSPRASQQAEIRIRRRVRNALIDASLLLRSLDETAIEQVFSPAPHAKEDREDVITGTIDFLALCRLGLARTYVPFDLALKEAIRRSETYRGTPAETVQVDISVDHRPDGVFDFARVTVLSEDDPEQFLHSEKVLLDELAEFGIIDPEELVDQKTAPKRVKEWAESQTE